MEPNPKKIFKVQPFSGQSSPTPLRKIITPEVETSPRKVAWRSVGSVVDFTEDISQQNVYSASQGENIAHCFEEAESSIKIDEEVATPMPHNWSFPLSSQRQTK